MSTRHSLTGTVHCKNIFTQVAAPAATEQFYFRERGGSSLKHCSGQLLTFARGRRSLKQFSLQMRLPAPVPAR
eukprot:1176104-Rhodomonas_salina.1